MTQTDGVMVEIRWAINPFRGDKFEEVWTPAAEAALDYGATQWALYRAKEGMLDFVQTALFPTKEHFEQYWYSEEIAAVRVAAAGYFQVPVLPTFHVLAGMGAIAPVAS